MSVQIVLDGTLSSESVVPFVHCHLLLKMDPVCTYGNDLCQTKEDELGAKQGIAYRIGLLSNAEISDFSPSRRVSRVEPPISSTFDKLGEGSAGEGTLARW